MSRARIGRCGVRRDVDIIVLAQYLFKGYYSPHSSCFEEGTLRYDCRACDIGDEIIADCGSDVDSIGTLISRSNEELSLTSDVEIDNDLCNGGSTKRYTLKKAILQHFNIICVYKYSGFQIRTEGNAMEYAVCPDIGCKNKYRIYIFNATHGTCIVHVRAHREQEQHEVKRTWQVRSSEHKECKGKLTLEQRTSFRYKTIEEMDKETYRMGNIQNVKNQQFEIMKHYRNQIYVLYLDATGSVVRNPDYAKIAGDITDFVLKFKQEVKKKISGWPLIIKAVRDYSYALMKAIVMVWNEMSLQMYLRIAYSACKTKDTTGLNANVENWYFQTKSNVLSGLTHAKVERFLLAMKKRVNIMCKMLQNEIPQEFVKKRNRNANKELNVEVRNDPDDPDSVNVKEFWQKKMIKQRIYFQLPLRKNIKVDTPVIENTSSTNKVAKDVDTLQYMQQMTVSIQLFGGNIFTEDDYKSNSLA
ncbi:hypothetical protein PR048_013420 [Dryococelus australis]|uniref:Uncharacterized protein n=1 Tax=Dryococelus australis TaxID=614101 RepID=A0ABQ9HS42_9NEOP|nr:hypothetical protein PR048_013420 [Dryococelus australis]